MRMFKYLIPLILLLVSVSAYAATGKMQVLEIVGGKKVATPSQQKIAWAWIENEEKVKELRLRAWLKSEATASAQRVGKLDPAGKGMVKNGVAQFQLSSMESTVELIGPKNRSFLLRYSGDGTNPVIDKNCRTEFQLALRPDGPVPPFYVGTACGRDSKGINVSLSYPSEVDLLDATFPEVKGKGEAWKYYELGPIQQTLKEIGKFSFTYKGKSYVFVLESVKQLSEAASPDTTIFSAGVGFAMLGIQGSDINASSGTPSIALRVPHYSLVDNFGISLRLDFAVPLQSGSGAVKFSQFGVFADYVWNVTSSFSLTPKVGYMFTSESEDATSIGLTASQPGFGLVSRLNVSTNWYITLEFLSAGFGSPSINSHYLVDLALMHRKAGSFGYGVGAQMQSFTATSGLGIQRTLSQMLFYGLLSF